MSSHETVSVVIPCYNEERFIVKALEQLAGQYEDGNYEIIVVDGMSEDETRVRINQFRENHPDVPVKIIDNPKRHIPTALNLGVMAASGEIIARMDAHAAPSRGYIQRCVEVLRQPGVGVVGMPCHIEPGANTLLARAIASGVSHKFGIGDATYRLREGKSLQEEVDTVAFACFRKSLWTKVNGFDETLLTNEDYDFNYRVRSGGDKVLLDRTGHCEYFARTTLATLATQYSRYGRWKAQMVRRRPKSVKLRHLIAPLFVASVLLLSLAGFFIRWAWWLLAIEIGLYLICSLIAGWSAARKVNQGLAMILLMPLVFGTIHICWGGNFLLGLIVKKEV